MNDANDNGINLKLLKLLKNNPELTQRQMNKEMNISLGKINFHISELVKEGLINIEKFIKTKKKAKYIYRLTPEGLDQIARLTFDSLNLRIKEYNRIRKEIKHLSEQIGDIDPNFCLDSEMIPGLKEDLKKLQS